MDPGRIHSAEFSAKQFTHQEKLTILAPELLAVVVELLAGLTGGAILIEAEKDACLVLSAFYDQDRVLTRDELDKATNRQTICEVLRLLRLATPASSRLLSSSEHHNCI